MLGSGDPGGRIRVVLVDDHEMVVASLVHVLADVADIEVVGTAFTALDGLALTRERRPDVAIFDYHLPDGSGVDAAERVRAELRNTKVVLLTGAGSSASYYAARRAGVAGWVHKNLKPDVLVEAIRRVHRGQTYFQHDFGDLPSTDELVAYYQPVVSLDTGAIVGFEALVRWNDAERGIIGPDAFLPLAEESGFVHDIAAWMLEEATAQLASWQHAFPRDPRLWMSINMSPSTLGIEGMTASVRSAIKATHVDPGDLVLEITETVLLEDTADNLDHLRSLKATGVSLSLDDFGSSYAQLSYLRTFPFDHIKLDGSFTADLPGGARARVLAEHVELLSHELHMEAIAEGIERREQAACLRAVGWHYGQGYLYSEPVDAARCTSLLKRRDLRAAEIKS